MSNSRLPAETLNHIIDHLRTTKDTLGNSCPVSNRSSHASEHPFSSTSGSVSPQGACKRGRRRVHILRLSCVLCSKTLSVNSTQVVVAADAEEGGWIRGFSRVVHLKLTLIDRRL